MIKDAEIPTRGQPSRALRGPLEQMLRLGPWCWPTGDEVLEARARDISQCQGPPAMVPGMVPLVTVSPGRDRATLWGFGVPSGSRGKSPVALTGEAAVTWRTVRAALPRSIPLIWRSLLDIWRNAEESIWRLNGVSFDALFPPSEQALNGQSLGLGLALSLASRVLGVPLPPDIIASASIDAHGRVGRVDGVKQKAACILACAPTLLRIFVATEQKQEWADRVASAGGTLEIVAVNTLSEAITAVWDLEQLENLLVEMGSEPSQQNEMTEALFALALSDRSVVLEWEPILKAAGLALSRWKTSVGQRRKLEFVYAVAERHIRNRGVASIPDERFLTTIPQPLRLTFVAHLVQQAADAGTPSPEDAENLADRHLVRGFDAFEGHIALLGALGRLHAVTGRPALALEEQEEAARAWLLRRCLEPLSYAMSEWLRLAGALNDSPGFGRAEALLSQAMALNCVDTVVAFSPYVAVAYGRGLVQLGQIERALGPLRHVSDDTAQPAFLRWSATRWLLRALEPAGSDRHESHRRMELLKGAARSDRIEARDAGLFLTWVQLDRALKAGENPAPWLDRLLEMEPQPLGRLLDAAATTNETSLPVYVRRFYPY